MKIACPFCLRKFGIEEGTRNVTMIELSEIGARLGAHYLLAWDYADAFRGKRDGTITAAKRLRIFKELASLLEKCVFEYDGRRYRTTPAGIKTALQAVCDAQKCGFRNHNYLKKVLLESSEKLSAEGLTAPEEAGRIQGVKDSRGQVEVREKAPAAIGDVLKNFGVGSMKELVRKKAGGREND
jgi:hypothetical protein